VDAERQIDQPAHAWPATGCFDLASGLAYNPTLPAGGEAQLILTGARRHRLSKSTPRAA
jgi:hypothetical protein